MSDTDGHKQQTSKFWRVLNVYGDILRRIHSVLDHMHQLSINLPILLWAISWNMERLINDDKIRWARTTLMVSDELPAILRNWWRPPRSHGKGIRTRAGSIAVKELGVEIVTESIDKEMKALTPVLSLPKDDLSEELLLAIKWNDTVAQVKDLAPTMWSLFRTAAYTQKQDRRNRSKNPDSVRTCTSLICLQTLISDCLDCPYYDRYGVSFSLSPQ
jgi:hypothetical protein